MELIFGVVILGVVVLVINSWDEISGGPQSRADEQLRRDEEAE